MQWTYEKVLALAPDPGTAQRAKEMAHAMRWHSLAGNGRAIWGTNGLPADPYRTQVDFQGPAFKCTCPVRRLPCKHGIGLLLLFLKNNDAFRVADAPPDWVDAWLKGRDARSGGIHRSEAPARSSEAVAALAEKRKENREKRMYQMAAGLAELESWLLDLLRQGLATLEGQAFHYWNDLAARMVDAKLGTIARRLRRMPGLMASPNWHEKILAELGDIYLMVKAFQRLDQLPEPLQDDLLGLAGVNQKKEDVLALPGVEDTWLVAGQTHVEEEGNLLARRTWLVGLQTQKFALLLDFSWGGQAFETAWRLGSTVQGELVFYPSAYPQRAVFKRFEVADLPVALEFGQENFAQFATAFATALAANPWLAQFPALLSGVVPVFFEDQFLLVDVEGHSLPLAVDDLPGWQLVAESCGGPIGVFGVWSDGKLAPFGTWKAGAYTVLLGGTL